jgi:hypothetical protein
MKKVYGSDNSIEIAHLRSLLESSHIKCITRNDFLQGAAGELPMMECWPEIWVLEDAQQEQARTLVEAFLLSSSGVSAWDCDHCVERIDAPFSQCWRCGNERLLWE